MTTTLMDTAAGAPAATEAASLEDRVEAYKRDGFTIIEDVLQGGELRPRAGRLRQGAGRYPPRLGSGQSEG